jgi:chromosome segregation ATPase|tara:strand:+ start:132 stop:389 length:258 start_codon:yes stop_codon:yes gene_type:complete
MTNPIDLIKEDIASAKEQLDIDVKKVSLLQQEIKQIQEQAQAAITEKQTQINTITQPILENQGYIKKQTEFLDKLEGKIEATTDK